MSEETVLAPPGVQASPTNGSPKTSDGFLDSVNRWIAEKLVDLTVGDSVKGGVRDFMVSGAKSAVEEMEARLVQEAARTVVAVQTGIQDLKKDIEAQIEGAKAGLASLLSTASMKAAGIDGEGNVLLKQILQQAYGDALDALQEGIESKVAEGARTLADLAKAYAEGQIETAKQALEFLGEALAKLGDVNVAVDKLIQTEASLVQAGVQQGLALLASLNGDDASAAQHQAEADAHREAADRNLGMVSPALSGELRGEVMGSLETSSKAAAVVVILAAERGYQVEERVREIAQGLKDYGTQNGSEFASEMGGVMAAVADWIASEKDLLLEAAKASLHGDGKAYDQVSIATQLLVEAVSLFTDPTNLIPAGAGAAAFKAIVKLEKLLDALKLLRESGKLAKLFKSEKALKKLEALIKKLENLIKKLKGEVPKTPPKPHGGGAGEVVQEGPKVTGGGKPQTPGGTPAPPATPTGVPEPSGGSSTRPGGRAGGDAVPPQAGPPPEPPKPGTTTPSGGSGPSGGGGVGPEGGRTAPGAGAEAGTPGSKGGAESPGKSPDGTSDGSRVPDKEGGDKPRASRDGDEGGAKATKGKSKVDPDGYGPRGEEAIRNAAREIPGATVEEGGAQGLKDAVAGLSDEAFEETLVAAGQRAGLVPPRGGVSRGKLKKWKSFFAGKKGERITDVVVRYTDPCGKKYKILVEVKTGRGARYRTRQRLKDAMLEILGSTDDETVVAVVVKLDKAEVDADDLAAIGDKLAAAIEDGIARVSGR